jgi:hypothetical protein
LLIAFRACSQAVTTRRIYAACLLSMQPAYTGLCCGGLFPYLGYCLKVMDHGLVTLATTVPVAYGCSLGDFSSDTTFCDPPCPRPAHPARSRITVVFSLSEYAACLPLASPLIVIVCLLQVPKLPPLHFSMSPTALQEFIKELWLPSCKPQLRARKIIMRLCVPVQCSCVKTQGGECEEPNETQSHRPGWMRR